MRISVVGLGKLGAPLVAVLASKGHTVVGLDLNPAFVDRLNAGVAPVDEPHLQELIDAARSRISATADYGTAVPGSDVTFVIVPTPSTEDGTFSNKYVLAAIEEIGRALRRKDGYHLVVVTSTVMPGSTGGPIREALETHSGRPLGDTLGLCYNPEFIALGSVIRDMLHPDLILIGESDRRAGDLLAGLYAGVCESDPSIQRMNFVNAELTKIAVNTYVTTKISYANMLTDVCERLPGADVDVVTAALGRDSRIGLKYLKGAVGYGGPCFPRDNLAFGTLARGLGARADLAEATDGINRYQVDRLAGMVRERLRPGGTVAILGLSYKPDTCVVEESQGVALANLLADDGYGVTVYDPAALGGAEAVLGRKASAAESAEACVRNAAVVVVMTPWPQFRELPPSALARDGTPTVVIDCWRVLPAERFAGTAELVYPGRGDREPEYGGAEAAMKATAS